MSDIYKTIEKLCTENHVSITQMCKETGVPRGSLTNLKMGRSETLSSKTLSKLAEYFRVPLDYFLGSEPQTGLALSRDEIAYIEWYRNDATELEKEMVRRIVRGTGK